jgi:hypothetical protein
VRAGTDDGIEVAVNTGARSPDPDDRGEPADVAGGRRAATITDPSPEPHAERSRAGSLTRPRRSTLTAAPSPSRRTSARPRVSAPALPRRRAHATRPPAG